MDDIILDPGDSSGDDYLPQIALQHDEQRSEMYVIVGEEAGGMIEGVPLATFERIAKRLAEQPVFLLWVSRAEKGEDPELHEVYATYEAAEKARDRILREDLGYDEDTPWEEIAADYEGDDPRNEMYEIQQRKVWK